MKLIIVFKIFLIFILFSACNNNKLLVDTLNIDVKIKFKKFDQDLMQVKTDSIYKEIILLEKNYGDFFILFNEKIIKIGSTNQKAYSGYLSNFINDEVIVELYNVVKVKFDDISTIENELENSFKYYKYYFPEKKIPEFYTFISGFNQSIVTTDNLIGIGLDKYLGFNCKYYKQLSVPIYLRYKMEANRIVPDCMMAKCLSDFPYNDSKDNVLNRMIYNGKIMYMLDALLPEYHDSIKIAYTTSQIKWCKANENNMWTYLVENKILFSSDLLTIKKLVDEAPYTSFFPKNSPPKAGIWLGWQIVRSYMENNSDVTVSELMKNENYQEILNQSRYKP